MLQLALGLLVGVLVFLMGYRWLPSPKDTPLFTGPPEFIVLSLIVAVGLYLRQVNLRALELCEKILNGEYLTKPHERRYADEKTKQLADTSRMIMFVSPFMIFLMLVVGVRIVADNVCRLWFDKEHPPRTLYGFDLVISVGLAFMLIGLAIAHFVARTHDQRIRESIQIEAKRATLGP